MTLIESNMFLKIIDFQNLVITLKSATKRIKLMIENVNLFRDENNIFVSSSFFLNLLYSTILEETSMCCLSLLRIKAAVK